MNEFENKLNRSHSESNIQNVLSYILPPVNSLCSRDLYKSSPTIIKRTLCIEEIIFPAGTMKPKSSRRHILESEYCRNKNISLGDFRNDSSRFNTSIRDQHSGLHSMETLAADDDPMEIDTSLNYDERYPKMMGSGLGTPLKTEEMASSDSFRYESKNNIFKPRLKAQNLNKVDNQNSEVGAIKCRNLADPQKLTHIKTVQDKKSNVKTFLLLISIVAAVFVGYYMSNKVIVNTDVQIENILRDLSENVHEQQHVIDVVVRSLERRENWLGKKKLLGFVGSQGVGKTFVADILKQHFAQHLAHEIYGPHLHYPTEKDKILQEIDACCLNLIVIDDLRKNDDVELFAFVQSLPRDHFVLVISIFNIHYATEDLRTIVNKNDILEIRELLDQSGLNQELVVFRDFTTEQIEDWARKQLAKQNLSSGVQETVMRAVLDAHDVKHGLKGLHSKISLEVAKISK